MFQDEPQNWRELVAQVISEPAGMQRITKVLDVREITVKRWINRFAEPRMQNLRGLLSALPEHRERLLEFYADEYEDFANLPLSVAVQEIPSRFYMQVFQQCGTVNPRQRYVAIAETIIAQALSQLDPEQLGMAITVVKCMKYSGREKIYSLRQGIGQSTPPWPAHLEQQALFLGAESLAGFVVSACRPFEVHDYRAEPDALLGHQFEHERSAIAHPILYAGHIAGCLLFSCTEPHYFFPPSRANLVADYAHLMALAFSAEDFIDPADLELRVMPTHAEQKPAFSTFRQRIVAARIKHYESSTNGDADQFVWEQLEDELLAKQHQKYHQESRA